MFHSYLNKSPEIHESVFVAPGAQIIGDVIIDELSSIWFNTVVRGDVNHIRIGKRTNIQDLTMVHVDHAKYPTIIGDDVTVGHKAIVHACTIADRCLIGMGAIIMYGAEVGEDCIIGAGALVTAGKKIASGSVVMGSPGKVVREIRDGELEWILKSSKNYQGFAQNYLK